MHVAMKTQSDAIKNVMEINTKWQDNEDKIDNAILQLADGNAILVKDYFIEGLDDLKASVQAYTEL